MASLLEIGLSNAAMATVLAVVAFALSRVCRRPAFIHGLWLVVLLKLVTPPLVPVPMPWFETQEPTDPSSSPTLTFVLAEPDLDPEEDAPAPVIPALDNAAMAELVPAAGAAEAGTGSGFLPFSWWWPILFIWLAGSVCRFVWIARSVLVFQRLLRFARLADPAVQDIVKELASQLKLARYPSAWLVPGKISPMLWVFGGRPRLIFPAALLERLDREQLRTIIMHELAHWRRRDHWVRFLELVVMVLYWWHPAAWWARAELHEAEEQCCDAWVVGTLPGADRTYALALLETVAFFSNARLPLPSSASGIGQASQLRRRLTMIMSGQKRRSLTWVGCAGLAAFGLLLLPLIPVRGQQPEKKERQGTIIIDGKQLIFGDGKQLIFGIENTPQKKKEGQGTIVIDGLGELHLQFDGGAPNQEAVELLKRALKLMVEKKAASAKPEAKVGNPDEVKKAHEQVDALTKQLAKQRHELEAGEARLREAKGRLAALQGKPANVGGLPLQLDMTKMLFGKNFQIQVAPEAPKPPVPPVVLKAKGMGLPQVLELRIDPNGKAVIVSGQKKETRTSPEELKSRLERLQREIEEIRRDLQRTPPADAKRERSR